LHGAVLLQPIKMPVGAKYLSSAALYNQDRALSLLTLMSTAILCGQVFDIESLQQVVIIVG